MPQVENPYEWPVYSFVIGDRVWPGEPVEVTEAQAREMTRTNILRVVPETETERKGSR